MIKKPKVTRHSLGPSVPFSSWHPEWGTGHTVLLEGTGTPGLLIRVGHTNQGGEGGTIVHDDGSWNVQTTAQRPGHDVLKVCQATRTAGASTDPSVLSKTVNVNIIIP